MAAERVKGVAANRLQKKDKSKKSLPSSLIRDFCTVCTPYLSYNLLNDAAPIGNAVLAFDLGAKMGVVLGRDNGELVECFELDLSKLSTAKRFEVYRQCIIELIVKFAPEAIFYEKVCGHRGVVAAHHFGYYEGTLKVHAGMIPILDMTPTAIKKNITGAGNADKETVRQAVCKLHNIDIPSRYTNASDAVAIFTACTRKAHA